MADSLLAEIPDRPFRVERLVDTVTDFCEHYFAWTVGALLDQVNNRLVEQGAPDTRRVCPELPLFIRYGVTGAAAIELLTSGVRSRELVTRVAAAARQEEIDLTELRSWLGQMSFAGWRERFDATAADVLDLLEYCRIRGVGVLRRLLSEGQASFDVDLLPPSRNNQQSHRGESQAETGATLEPVVVRALTGFPTPAQLAVFAVEGAPAAPRATIPASLHSELQAVLDTALEIDGSLSGSLLTLRLAEER
jgi:hypothetical protein